LATKLKRVFAQINLAGPSGQQKIVQHNIFQDSKNTLQDFKISAGKIEKKNVQNVMIVFQEDF
jgi:hypothetical protein